MSSTALPRGSHARASRRRVRCIGQRSTLLAATIASAVLSLSTAAQLQALTAAGAFGRGANQQVVRAVRAVTDALTTNLLGFVGATLVLVIVGLAAGHIYGDERASEKTLRVVKGVFMLVAAAGIVA